MRSDCATIDPCRPSLSSARLLRVTSLLETDIHRRLRCALRACPACSGRRTACPCTPGPARIGPVARIAIFGQNVNVLPSLTFTFPARLYYQLPVGSWSMPGTGVMSKPGVAVPVSHSGILDSIVVTIRDFAPLERACALEGRQGPNRAYYPDCLAQSPACTPTRNY